MFLWVVAVLEVDGYLDDNNGPDLAPCEIPKRHYFMNPNCTT